jgi:mannose-6-phosphate isomerase
MQPLRFKPYLKQTLWGGERIVPFKHLESDLTQVGESWEISTMPGHESVVDGGPYDGEKLSEVIVQEGARLVGKANFEKYGHELPLLVKFIDAAQPLSIQVHPDDATARRQGRGRGKNEMWYVLNSSPEASLLVGLKQKITPEEYTQLVENDHIVDALCRYPVKEGDCFYLPAGRIHSIGAGCFLAEIQQASDVTYRIYDFKRKDKDGHYRELHTKLAAESIDYEVKSNYRTQYVARQNQGVALIHCVSFHTFVYDVTQPMTVDLKQLDSFVILIVTKGSGFITTPEGDRQPLEAGNTLLISADTPQFKVEGEVTFLMSYA